jgi:adenylate cyclase class 2
VKHEYEAKFLSVDVAGLQAKLTALGAVRAFPRSLLTRKIFENDALDGGAWLRLRDEGTRCTLTLVELPGGVAPGRGRLRLRHLA